MKRYVYDKDGNAREVTVRNVDWLHYVQPDYKEHGGRAKFREYLKRTGSVEMGHSDIQAAQERYRSRLAAEAEELKRAKKMGVDEAEPPDNTGEIREYVRSRMNNEVRNRLEGRPMPPIEQLIKMTLEEARRLR